MAEIVAKHSMREISRRDRRLLEIKYIAPLFKTHVFHKQDRI